ncbi:MAG: sigma-54-dependent Fis family transcriptional regulator [Ignavibacteriales bacterium]|nr:sigma-54-dependent Fis family transcriptional regulator [Ignavibacteriales bacterium]
MTPEVLVVDDEKNILNTIGICLESVGIKPKLTSKPQEVLGLINEKHFDLAFVDLKMTPMDGMEVLAEIKKYSPATTVVIMTAHGTIDSAVDAIKHGAHDYLQKPFDYDELKLFVGKVWDHHRLREEVVQLRHQLQSVSGTQEIVTRNRTMLDQLDLARRVADSTISVLIEGESGTGKELYAHYIHNNGARAEKPFIRVNCAAIPEQLLESELFGHVRGSFTGAVKDRQGRFELADGGTIFLDEIAELSLSIQAKLLRVLQSKEYERVGESTPRQVDVRIIAATNRNLDEALKEGSFRQDLFYRLNAVRIKLPPLRERPEDVSLLIHHFLKKFSGARKIEISPEAEQLLRVHRWSGNVRELENAIERAMLLVSEGAIRPEHLPDDVKASRQNDQHPLSLEEMEKNHIRRVLQTAKDYDEAARILGIDRKTLLNKRKRFDL